MHKKATINIRLVGQNPLVVLTFVGGNAKDFRPTE